MTIEIQLPGSTSTGYKGTQFFRIMRLTTLFVLIGCIHLSAESYSQTISLKAKGCTLQEVFKAIQQQTDYKVIYNVRSLEQAKPVDISARQMPLEIFLMEVFKRQALKYDIREGTILVGNVRNQIREDVTANTNSNGQQRVYLGKVMDEFGSPLEGVTVTAKGTQVAVITDKDGNYQISVPQESRALLFTIVGFESAEEELGKQPIINAYLKMSVSDLEEIVVVGFGAQKKASVVGAITAVDPTLFKIGQARTVTNSLAGQMAGIIAVQRSGEPGYDGSDFWIRGINTFGANSTPLVLVDGVERSLHDISPDEIASFSILKDATATAVYGVRGANGVILIQTPRGTVGTPRISVRSEYGVSSPTQLPKFVGGAKYMEVINSARELSGLNPSFSDEAIRLTATGEDPDFYPDVNWLEAVTNDRAYNQRLVVDINGGSERLRYSLIVSYFGEKGITVVDPNVAYDATLRLSRFNVRTNVDINLSPTTVMNIGIGGFQQDRNSPGIGIDGIFNDAFVSPPIIHPIKYSNGQLASRPNGANAWAQTTQTGFAKNYNSKLESTVSIQQEFEKFAPALKGLNAKTLFSFDAWNYSDIKRTKGPTFYQAYGREEDGNLLTNLLNEGQEFLGYSRGAGGNRSMYFETQLNYNRKFSQHTIGGLLLFNLRDYVDFNSGSAIGSLPYRNQGLAGRITYNFNDKYFIETNFGYNGSENFKRGKRFGFFPSVAIGWLLINEDFMRSTPYLSNLKLRGSWGLVGNDQIGGRRFAYIPTIGSAGGYNWGYQGQTWRGGWQEDQFGVPSLTWETAEKINMGLEFGLWNAVNLQADIFKELRKNIFMQRKTIPEIAGFNNPPYANFGRVENKGMDLSLDAFHKFSDKFSVAFRGNYTFARNKVLEFDEPEELKRSSRAQTGQSLNTHYGLTATGLFKEEDFENGHLKHGIAVPSFGEVKPGDIQYMDLNGDNVIDAFDQSPIGRPWVPETIYGFGATLQYRGFDFGVFFQGASNFTNMLRGATFIPGSGGGGLGNIYENVDDRWTPEHPHSDVFWPRLSIIDMDNNKQSSTWWLRDASYLRLKNLELGWSLPNQWLDQIKIKSARVMARGTNLFTWAPFNMWDPEIGSNNGLKYPTMRVYSFGIELTL